MPTCSAGHETASTDFCDVCGMRVGASAGSPPSGPAASASGPPCPRCGAARTGQFCETCGYDFASGVALRRLETAPAAPAPAPAAPSPPPAAPALAPAAASSGSAAAGPAPGTTAPGTVAPGTPWMAVVTADRAYFDSVVAAGGPDSASIEFPVYCPERRFRLSGAEMRIGRRSASRGLEPEIDLTGPPADPGVSHLHAVLIAEPDGSWAVLDPGSANGTLVNGREMATGARVRLRDGDRVCVGAWTVLTIRTA
jgi:FHA domain